MASEFEAPKKLINKLPDLQKWQKSEVSNNRMLWSTLYNKLNDEAIKRL